MANPSKNKGTAWESEIVRFVNSFYGAHVERRTLGGSKDRGDIAGIPGVVIEAKNASKIELAGWLLEAHKEALADSLETRAPCMGVVWAKRRGRASAADGYVVMDGVDFMVLLGKAGYL